MRLRKLLLPVLALLSVTTLGGCVTTGSQGTSDVVPCENLAAITWSHKDTPETQRQVVGYNAVGKSICHWAPNHNVGFSWASVPHIGGK